MPAAERARSFVVVGEFPLSFAVAAERVGEITQATAFDGPSLQLEHLTTSEGSAEPGYVLVLEATGGEVGLLVRGRPRLLAVSAEDVLPLPGLLTGESRMSHVLAPGGRPLVPVLDLARLDEDFSSLGTRR
jgi:hypothetical protein